MCDYKLWCETEENVYVLQCLTCNNFQVRFLNTALMFDYNEYQLFYKVIADHYNNIEESNSTPGLLVPAFNKGVELWMDKTNLVKLYHLPDYADGEICAARLTGLFDTLL